MLEEITKPLQASFTKVLAIFAVAGLCWFVVTTLIAYFKLRHIPGPSIAGFTNW